VTRILLNPLFSLTVIALVPHVDQLPVLLNGTVPTFLPLTLTVDVLSADAPFP